MTPETKTINPPKERTEKQKRQQERAWKIRNLRALYALAHQLTEPNRSVVQNSIDAELILHGALATKDHQAKMMDSYIDNTPCRDL